MIVPRSIIFNFVTGQRGGHRKENWHTAHDGVSTTFATMNMQVRMMPILCPWGNYSIAQIAAGGGENGYVLFYVCIFF